MSADNRCECFDKSNEAGNERVTIEPNEAQVRSAIIKLLHIQMKKIQILYMPSVGNLVLKKSLRPQGLTGTLPEL